MLTKTEGTLDFAIHIDQGQIGPYLWIYICEINLGQRRTNTQYTTLKIGEDSWRIERISMGPLDNQPHIEC